MLRNPENNCLFRFQSLFYKLTNKRGNENSYKKPLPQTSWFNTKHYNPVRTTTYLGIILETRRGKGHCEFSFNKVDILKRILNLFKSALPFRFECKRSLLQFI